jgi:hypothetical protein
LNLQGIKDWKTPTGWHVCQVHYTSDPGKRDPGWAERTRKALAYDRTKWAREFEIDWTAGLGACYFNAETIRDHYIPLAGGPSFRGYIQMNGDNPPEFWQRDRGGIVVWRLPNHQTRKQDAKWKHRYCIGADVAEGLEKHDYSSGYVLDRLTFEFVAAYHGHADPDHFAQILNNLGRFYGEPDLHDCARLGVEVNNHGHTVINELRKHHQYPGLYTQERFNQRNQAISNQIGWLTTAKSKPVLIDGFAVALREKELVIHDLALLNECLRFVNVDGKLGAQGNNHDDRVMAAAIALQVHKSMPAPKRWEPPVTGWRARLNQAQESNSWVGA